MQPSSPMDRRRSSAEWGKIRLLVLPLLPLTYCFPDASKVPPSRFQKRKGSIYAVPSSRDGHIDSNYNHKFHEKHKELWKDLTGANNANTNPSNGNS